MKKIYGFAALCAAMTLASCSNNDEPIVNPVAPGNVHEVNAGYLSVNIAKSKDTRAANGDYEYGTADESKATKATFIFLNGDGEYVSKREGLDLTATYESDATDPVANVERQYTVMVDVNVEVPDGFDATNYKGGETQYVEDKATSIKSVMVILNPTAAIHTAIQDKLTAAAADNKAATVDDFRGIAADYSTTALTSSNAFVMTNSVYQDDSNNNVYSQDVEGKIKKSQLEATQYPASIYVERVVARVDVKYPTAGITKDNRDLDVFDYLPVLNEKGEETDELEFKVDHQKLAIVVTGVQVANVANQSWLVKSLDSNSIIWTGWNNADDFRSHWATSWSINGGSLLAPSRLETVVTDQTNPAETWFRNFNYNGFKPFSADANDKGNYPSEKFYINENTNQTYKTALMISAMLCETNEDGTVKMDGENPVGAEIYRTVKDGRYTTEEGAYNVLLGLLQRQGYRYATAYDETSGKPTAFEDLGRKHLEFKSAVKLGLSDAQGYEGYLAFKDETMKNNIYRTTDGGVNYTQVADLENKVLWKNTSKKLNEGTTDETVTDTSEYKVWKWNGGKCYYWVNLTNGDIKVGTPEKLLEGVVRNHIYQVTLTSIAGLGVPVFDPTDVIIPVTPPKITPEDDWSLAANINILSWTWYNQNANFTQGDDY